jgi:hypothetical protein
VDAPSEQIGDGYDGASVAGAALLTLIFPLFTLIAALLLQGGQQDPRKKAQLRTWIWASAGLLVLEAAIFLFLQSVTL